MSTKRNYAPFNGDGRFKIDPIDPLAGTRPIRVTASMARMFVDMFMDSGHSVHSAQGATLWVVPAWCEQNKVLYEIQPQEYEGKTVGYVIKRL